MSLLLVFQAYRGMWRYLGIADLMTLAKVTVLSSAILVIVLPMLVRGAVIIPRSVLVIDFLLFTVPAHRLARVVRRAQRQLHSAPESLAAARAHRGRRRSGRAGAAIDHSLAAGPVSTGGFPRSLIRRRATAPCTACASWVRPTTWHRSPASTTSISSCWRWRRRTPRWPSVSASAAKRWACRLRRVDLRRDAFRGTARLARARDRPRACGPRRHSQPLMAVPVLLGRRAAPVGLAGCRIPPKRRAARPSATPCGSSWR